MHRSALSKTKVDWRMKQHTTYLYYSIRSIECVQPIGQIECILYLKKIQYQGYYDLTTQNREKLSVYLNRKIIEMLI